MTRHDSDRDVPDCLRRLTPEELANAPPITKEQICKALEQGRRDREALEQMIPPDSGEREVCKHGGPGGDCAVCVAEREYRVPISHNLAQRILAALDALPWAVHTDDLVAVKAELRAAVERKP